MSKIKVTRDVPLIVKLSPYGEEIMGYKKVTRELDALSLREFKKRCKEKNIEFSNGLWNAYIDKCWDQIEKDYQIALDKKKARE